MNTIQFRAMVVDGVPAVEILDEAGHVLAVMHAGDDGRSVEVMSNEFDGDFVRSVEFENAGMTGQTRTPPAVRMRFRAQGAMTKDKIQMTKETQSTNGKTGNWRLQI